MSSEIVPEVIPRNARVFLDCVRSPNRVVWKGFVYLKQGKVYLPGMKQIGVIRKQREEPRWGGIGGQLMALPSSPPKKETVERWVYLIEVTNPSYAYGYGDQNWFELNEETEGGIEDGVIEVEAIAVKEIKSLSQGASDNG